MKPLSLRLENFRSFRTARDFDFRNLRLFAIIGDTGVGKTSILEAMAYGLFGQANSYEGRSSSELLANGMRSGSVTFTFSVDREEYTVHRLLRANNAQVQLRCETRGIEVRGARAVNEKIQDILCMDFKSFMHTMLLPQGMHTRLLKSTEADRTKVLSQLFKLEDLDDIGRVAGEEERRARNYLEVLDVELADYGGNIEERIAQIERELADARAALIKAKDAAAKVEAIELDLRQAGDTKTALDAQASALRNVDALARDLAGIDALNDELSPRLAELQRRHDEAARAKADAEQNVERFRSRGLDLASLREVERHLTQVAAAVPVMNVERERRVTLTAKAAELNAAVASAEETIVAIRIEQAALASDIAKANIAHNEQRQAIDALDRVSASVIEAEHELTVATEIVSDVERRKGPAEQAVSEATADADAAASRLRDAEVACSAAQLDDRVAAIAGHLHTGDDCPVCRRTLPATFSAPKNVHLAKAQSDVRNARAALDQTARAAQTARLNLNTLETDLRNVAERVNKMQRDVAGRRTKLRELLDDGEEVAVAMRRLTQARETTELQVGDFARNRSALDARLVVESQALTEAQTNARSVESLLRESHQRFASAELSFSYGNDHLGQQFRSAADVDTVQEMQERVAGLVTEATEVDAANLAAVNAFARVADERRVLEDDYAKRVRIPKGQLLERLHAIARGVNAGDAPQKQAQQKRWVARVITAARKRVAAIAEEAQNLQRILNQKQTQRNEILEAVGGQPQRLVQYIAVHVRDTENRLVTARRDATRTADLVAKRQRVANVSSGLFGLRLAMLPASFPTFATRQRQRRLIEEATVILRSISNGQFSFTNNLDIFDTETNASRSSHSLSGGEAFQASVALSLAAVQVASNAGNKIESLFLDEGFDSLDNDRLDSVMMELRKRAQAGRTICVISHVGQVTEYVDTTMQVFKTTNGSDYKLRGSLDEDEAAVEGLISHLAAPSRA